MCGVRFSCAEVLLRLLGIGLSNGAVIALNAIGVTLVYGVVRMINFASGDLFALTTVLVGTVIAALGLHSGLGPLPLAGGLLLAFGAAMAFGALLNIAVERVAFRPFRPGSRLAPLIAGIGLSFILYQGALFWRTTEVSFIPGEHRSVPGIPEVPRGRIPDLLPDLDLVRVAGLSLNAAYTLKDLLVLLLAATIALGVGWFLRSTTAGRALAACSQDAEMAQLCGINPDSAIRLAFGIGGALAGTAAFVFAIYYNHPFTSYGAQSGLIAFTAAVLGGIGRPSGAFVSGLLLGVLTALSDYFLSARWTPVLVLTILILLLVLRPTGLASEDRGADTDTAPAAGMGRARAISTSGSRLLAGGLLALGLAYPLLDAALRINQIVVVIGMLIFALLALGLNIVLGQAGLLDLGYAASFAIGAYTAALLTSIGGRVAAGVPGGDILLVLALSGVAAGLFGALNGALTLRLRGDYLAIVTLAFGQIIPLTFLNLGQWTGGARGISALPPPRLLTYTLQSQWQRYYLVLAVLLLVAAASRRLVRSRIGRAWAAIGDDEMAAASCGVSPVRSRTTAFVLGTAVAGMAGALFASTFSYVDPTQSEFRVSAMVLAMVVIGGVGSVPGAIVGALLVAGYDQLAIPLLGAWLERLADSTGWQLLSLLDLRGLNFLSFGLALYLTTLLRARRSH